ncbi:ABC transporter permease [Rhodanobacter sp. C05]|uniref:ABC transporter permease n=1 Tax=Rhodanobacter sp. C05 TaxID=1945855 RepID=UPI00098745D6|nr:ABC transporter permease [Rhodanobacter sp. C05]OOG36331.1 peptide ABC transporter permease [Rhodanobacter sp. C05]
MTMHPILAALRKHKAGVVLISLQIALTLAIVCNAVFIIGQRVERVNRPTGLDENDLFLVTQQWVGAPSGDDPAGVEKLDVMQREDLAALRNLPDVASVAPSNSVPLLNSSWTGSLSLKPADTLGKGNPRTAYYFTDEQAMTTLGLHLVAGRAFNAGDVQHQGARDQRDRPVVIVTQALADKLFPQGNAVGKVIYSDGSAAPSTIIGVVARLQIPSTGSFGNDFAWYSTLVPTRLDASFARYVVRAKPGRRDAAMHAVPAALYAVNPMRVLDDDESVKSFADIRASAYRADVGMAILMGVVCLILLCVTAAGIVGLTSFWVGQRHRQIGVRRALGARKIDILHYFQIENLLIAGGGVVLGVLLAVGLNTWLMTHYEMTRIPLLYVVTGVLAMLAIGQAAVFVPARRASNVPPVEATRAA